MFDFCRIAAIAQEFQFLVFSPQDAVAKLSELGVSSKGKAAILELKTPITPTEKLEPN